jgi:hypothetical protein
MRVVKEPKLDITAMYLEPISRSNQTQMGGGGNDVLKMLLTLTNVIQMLFAGYP